MISLIQTLEVNLTETYDLLQQMKELATKASNEEINVDELQEIQNEINQLNSEINHIANNSGFNAISLFDVNTPTTTSYISSSICPIQSGVDMSNVVLNMKDRRLSGELVKHLKGDITTTMGLMSGTYLSIFITSGGRAIISGRMITQNPYREYNINSYELTLMIDNITGDVSFTGYGLEITMPLNSYLNITNDSYYSQRDLYIYINNWLDNVNPHSGISTNDAISCWCSYYYQGYSGAPIKDLKITGVDNLTSIFISGVMGSTYIPYFSGISGISELLLIYTLSDGTQVNDNIRVLSGDYGIYSYSGIGGLNINFNTYWYHSGNCPFTVNLSGIQQLVEAGGVKKYKSVHNPINFVNTGYSLTSSDIDSLQVAQNSITPINLLDDELGLGYMSITNLISIIDNKIDEISHQKEIVHNIYNCFNN